ncbi:sulfatase-like hydrolase/transferase [Candidatus Sumerlaeota bacterium]|nr:sulfatase-like hydrolase/transferase [Candidatus Sumerlaeota bacterium]
MRTIRRREFLKLAGAGAGALAAPLTAAELSPKKRPNIVYLFTDQQRWDMLSCAGNQWLKTPAMDRLAANGTRFEQAYCANPVCMPSRFTMFTGTMPSRIGIEDNDDIKKEVPAEILERSLGWLFRNAGYETAYGGKVHLPMTVEQIGFDRISTNERAGLADACAAFIRKQHDRPFLLVGSFINPHDICYMALAAAMKEFRIPREPSLELAKAMKPPDGVSRREFLEKRCPPLPPNFEVPQGEPEGVRQVDPREFRFWVRDHWTEQDWRLHRWAYCRLTEVVDAEIGVVLRALRDAGLEENTIVVLSSDHGDMDASHRLEHKSVLYEEAMRVPFIVSWKGLPQPGLVDTDHLISNGLDLIPTLCDFAGITPPKGLAGRSVRPLAEGRKPDAWRDVLATESKHCRTIRTARFKYTVYDIGQRREALVDLEKDPGEMKNLAADPAFRRVLVEHRQLLRESIRATGDSMGDRYAWAGY